MWAPRNCASPPSCHHPDWPVQTAISRGSSVCSAAAKARTAESRVVQPADVQSPAARQQAGGAWPQPLARVNDRPPIVALGKFDALHRGHRALAAEAAAMGGQPWLVSFSGMAEVLGWPRRLPLVAPMARVSVLQSWAPFCCGCAPMERRLPFAAVRGMSPEDFVRLLTSDLRAAGVVVGTNYRFGYKAKGTADTLQRLGRQYGVEVHVLDLVGAQQPSSSQAADASSAASCGGTVSSSQIRSALEHGDIRSVERALDRPYQLILSIPSAELPPAAAAGWTLRLPSTAYRNQPPGAGSYAAQLSSAPGGEQWSADTAGNCEVEVTFTGDGCIVHGLSAWPVSSRTDGTITIALTLAAQQLSA